MPERPGPAAEPSVRHLLGRLQVCERRVRRSIAARRLGDPGPDDPLRGLYLSDEHLEWILAAPSGSRAVPDDPDTLELQLQVEKAADREQEMGAEIRLRRLQQDFCLSDLDVELLLVALAPELDTRFEKLYGYLNDDVTRRRPTAGLALELAGAHIADHASRSRLLAGGPLLAGRLVAVEDDDQAFLARLLRVPDRVIGHLLGSDVADPALDGVLDVAPPPAADGSALARALAAGARLVYLMESPGSAARSLAADGLARAGLGALMVDLGLLAAGDDPAGLLDVVGREARLTGSGVVAGPVEALATRSPSAVRALTGLAAPVVVVGRSGWDPAWAGAVPALLGAPTLDIGPRAGLWRRSLGDSGVDPDAASAFRLAPEAIARSAEAARLLAAVDGTGLGPEHLLAGARAQNGAGLEKLARRVVPAVGWEDLVVRPAISSHLRDLVSRARNRDRVLGVWRMRPGGGRGRGVTALFCGDPGTGKTMAAEVVAGALGLDLYTVDLATVVDKYIGETEKNLERIFSEAEGVNGVILFDEADALFSKRSDVGDAHDRHANVEVAYLLQRMERFDGVAVLSTNLRTNLDEAFARRLDAIVEFPLPGEEERLSIWERCLPPLVPRDADVDLRFCARAFDLSGGSIRSASVSAAYLAAEAERPLAMADLVRSIEREYRKLGRLVLDTEFGPWAELVR